MKTEKKPVSSISNEKNKRANIELKLMAGSFLATIALFFSTCLVYDNVIKNRELQSNDNAYSVKSSANKVNLDNLALSGTKEIAMESTNKASVSTEAVAEAVTDTTAPVITLNKEQVEVFMGNSFDLKTNIKSVNDSFDGDLSYSTKEENAHYTISSNVNTNRIGEYSASVKALDSNGNKSESTFKIKVVQNPNAPKEEEYSNRASSVDTSSVMAAANSLKGTRYRSGGTNPNTGFDCSGFVQYVYAAVGKSISRSSSSQRNDGVAVERGNLQPGDIIIWANDGSSRPAHSSIYIGNNNIIHATTNKGVHVNNIDQWDSYGQHIIGIRRV